MHTRHHRSLRLLALSLPVLLTASCSDDFMPGPLPEGVLPMQFACDIDQDNSTRADESGFADGDRMGVFVVNYRDGSPGSLTLNSNQANNVALTFDYDANKWNAATDIYWLDKTTPADIYGYYPFFNGLSSVTDYSFEVNADQSRPAQDGDICSYEASDFLWAKAEKATPGQKVNLTYTHRMAGVKVVLQEGSGFADGQWAKVSKLVTVDNTTRHSSIDLQTGMVTATGGFDRNIVMNDDATGWRAVVVPQTVAAGKTTIGITIDGKPFAYTRDGGMKYTAGKMHTFTIKVDWNEGNGKYTLSLVSEEITNWIADEYSHDFEANAYFVVNCPKEGTLRECIAAAGADYTTLRNLKIIGRLTNSDIYFMKDEMPRLSSLNMKEARMVNIEIPIRWDQPSEYQDDMMPGDSFYGNRTIRRFVLPENLKRIGGNAFRETTFTSTLIIPESVTRIDDSAFGYLSADASLELPNSLEYIGPRAFWTDAVFELRLSNKLKYIGDEALAARNAYGTFFLPDNLEYLGGGAFNELGGISHAIDGEIIFPAHYKKIPGACFSCIGFRNKTKITIEEGVTEIGGNALHGEFSTRVIIPKTVKRIEGGAFAFSDFRNGVSIPENLSYIGERAFHCSHLDEDIVFPTGMSYANGAFSASSITGLTLGDNIFQINGGAFYSCTNLRKITIGKNVEAIGDGAFTEMWSLQTVVCLATTPPKATGTIFEGFDRERTVLEVPEQSVEAYRAADGWNVFRIITPHKELTCNIPDISCLDKGVTRKAMVRSEGEWEVSECPSWVHVSPMKGEFKDEITFNVDPVAEGGESREGNVVFSLKGKNYTTYTSVRQFVRDGEREDREITLQTASGPGNPIPVFIVGEGFTADDIMRGDYVDRMRQTMEHLFAIEPYKSHRDKFTVSTAVACSAEKGVGNEWEERQNVFGTCNASPNVWKVRDYVSRVSPRTGSNLGNALIIVVTNQEGFEGWSEICDDGCSIANVFLTDDVYPYDQRGLVQHHAGGAAFAGLGTEAIHHFEHIKGCTCGCCNALGTYNEMKRRGYFENLTMSSNMNEAPWRDFIFHPTYSNHVDMWEGGYRHYRGVFRSEANSVMNTYISYYNTISRYAIYKQIMRRAGLEASLEDFIANDKIEKPL